MKLYHFLHRSYSPRLGRWLQRDPLGYVDGVSLYEYVASAPTGWIDPLGLCFIDPKTLLDLHDWQDEKKKLDELDKKQVITREQLIAALNRFQRLHPDVPIWELLELLRQHLWENGFAIEGGRYLYTESGWIDLMHFVSAAAWSTGIFDWGPYGPGYFIAMALGWGKEWHDALQLSESGHPFGGNEDMRSNHYGARFGESAPGMFSEIQSTGGDASLGGVMVTFIESSDGHISSAPPPFPGSQRGGSAGSSPPGEGSRWWLPPSSYAEPFYVP